MQQKWHNCQDKRNKCDHWKCGYHRKEMVVQGDSEGTYVYTMSMPISGDHS
jgi:hypothetical protein